MKNFQNKSAIFIAIIFFVRTFGYSENYISIV